MEYAIQLLLPIIGGLLLGNWLHQTFGLSYLWMVILAILGMIAGIGILYKRQMYGDASESPKIPTPTLSLKQTSNKEPKTLAKTDMPEEKPSEISHQELLDLYKKMEKEPLPDKDDFDLKEILLDDNESDEQGRDNPKP